MFYALRHRDYFDDIEFGQFVIDFYERVAKWHKLPEGPAKNKMYAQLNVDAFRIRARTSTFLSTRSRRAGQFEYGERKFKARRIKRTPIELVHELFDHYIDIYKRQKKKTKGPKKLYHMVQLDEIFV